MKRNNSNLDSNRDKWRAKDLGKAAKSMKKVRKVDIYCQK